MFYLHPRQDQKSAVVDHTPESFLPLGGTPTQPPIARRTSPRSRSKQQAAHIPPLPIAGQISHVFPHDPKSQIVIALQVKGPPLGFTTASHDLFQSDRPDLT